MGRELKPGRCRCSRRVTEDGKGCQWHTAVQAEVLREIAVEVQSRHPFFGRHTLRRQIRSLLVERRD